MEILIRQATVADAKEVVAVLNSVIMEGKYTALTSLFTEEEERAFIAALGGRSAMFVAEVNTKIVGIQVLEPDALAHYSDSMQHVATVGTWVQAEFRGYKIGHSLAEASFTFARDKNYEKIAIQVVATNERALRFYGNLGFEKIGIARKHVKLEGKFHDTVYLEKFLNGESVLTRPQLTSSR